VPELVGARLEALWALRGQVQRYVESRGADWCLTDDVVAETYVVAWRRLDEVPGGDEAALGWLCGVARRVLANARRSVQRVAALVERVGLDRGDEAVSDAGGWRSGLMDAWVLLPEGDRRVLWLVGWQGVGLAELAELLDCSVGAAAKRLSRARARLAG
jgi:RNA polymerase sigma factor (sigma-70 family)